MLMNRQFLQLKNYLSTKRRNQALYWKIAEIWQLTQKGINSGMSKFDKNGNFGEISETNPNFRNQNFVRKKISKFRFWLFFEQSFDFLFEKKSQNLDQKPKLCTKKYLNFAQNWLILVIIRDFFFRKIHKFIVNNSKWSI